LNTEVSVYIQGLYNSCGLCCKIRRNFDYFITPVHNNKSDLKREDLILPTFLETIACPQHLISPRFALPHLHLKEEEKAPKTFLYNDF
jgi:hypothetical protein